MSCLLICYSSIVLPNNARADMSIVAQYVHAPDSGIDLRVGLCIQKMVFGSQAPLRRCRHALPDIGIHRIAGDRLTESRGHPPYVRRAAARLLDVDAVTDLDFCLISGDLNDCVRPNLNGVLHPVEAALCPASDGTTRRSPEYRVSRPA